MVVRPLSSTADATDCKVSKGDSAVRSRESVVTPSVFLPERLSTVHFCRQFHLIPIKDEHVLRNQFLRGFDRSLLLLE